MSTTTEQPSKPATARRQAEPMPPQQQPLPGRRNPRLLAIGVLCVILGGLGTAFAFLSATDTVEVLAFSRDVSSGQQINSSDIAVVRINADTGLNVVSVDKFNEVVGSQALTDVAGGSLVNPANFGQITQPGNTVLVGLRLSYGWLPGDGLQVGGDLLLVLLDDAPTAGVPVDGVPPVDAATVRGTLAAAPRLLADGTNWVVDVWVDASDAPTVARMSAAERVVIVGVGA